MTDEELNERILASIKDGLRNAISTNLYKDHQSPEDKKFSEQLNKIQQEIRDLLKEYGCTSPITFDLVKRNKNVRERYFNDMFPAYDVYGYKPLHKGRLVITEFTINPKKSYKFITFGSESALFDDFINKQEAIEFCRKVYGIIRNECDPKKRNMLKESEDERYYFGDIEIELSRKDDLYRMTIHQKGTKRQETLWGSTPDEMCEKLTQHLKQNYFYKEN